MSYHQDFTAISRTMLSDFAESPVMYYRKYIARNLVEEPSEALLFGTRFHSMVFEPQQFSQTYAIEPNVGHRGRNPGKKAIEEFRRANAGKESISYADAQKMIAMLASLSQDRLAWKLLCGKGQAEHVIKWTDPETGLPCKAKIDKLLLAKGIVVDLKTARSCVPDDFNRLVPSLGYDRQAAWYLDGVEAVFGKRCEWINVVCQTEECHEHSIIRMTADKIEVGRRKNRETLAELKERMDAGAWSSRFAGKIFECDVTKFEREKLYGDSSFSPES